MGICTEQYRISIGIFERARVKNKSTLSFSVKRQFRNFSSVFLNIVFCMITLLLLHARHNDIESNPGPPERGHGNVNGKTHDLNICHLNIQSIQRNKEKLKHIKLQLADG